MPYGNNKRMDNSRFLPSSCSTGTFAVFVGLCLLGAWMMASMTEVSMDMKSTNKNSEENEDVTRKISTKYEDSYTEERIGRSVENSPTGLKLDNNDAEQGETDKTNENSNSQEDKYDKTSRSSGKEYSSEIGSETAKVEPDNLPKSQTFIDEDGNSGGGEVTKESYDKTEDLLAAGKDKIAEQILQDSSTGDADLQENKDQVPDNSVSNQQYSDETKGDDAQQNFDNGKIIPVLEGNEEGNKENRDFKAQEPVDENTEESKDKEKGANSNDIITTKTENKEEVQNEQLGGAQSDLKVTEAWSTQAAVSKNEKEFQSGSSTDEQDGKYSWKLCNVTAGADYIPCLDNEEAIKKLSTNKHYEHRERHCPDEAPACLVPLPQGYKQPISWPDSRNKIWYFNVPHTQLATVKGHQNWVKVTGEFLTFPGGGTQFKRGALQYIDFIQQTWPAIAWGKRSRVILDVGCGVASFGGYIFDRDVLTMSLAPKDEHEAQVQFALERGIPAISAVMGTKRLPFPSKAFDAVHCARCRVPWHIEGGILLLELNRLIRPGGYFLWSATPVYQKQTEDVEIWKAMLDLTKSMCWELVNKSRDSVQKIGISVFKKPMNNECYERRAENNPPICQDSDDANAAWNVPLQACMHKLPIDSKLRGSQWPENWPKRLETTPYWLDSSQLGVYGKPAPADFEEDYKHWKHVVGNSYLNGLGLDWSKVRNVMDMRAVYGGFAAVLKEKNLWVMNIVSVNAPDTLPIIFERGLFGIYHDWCESFSTYPRTYDLLHADHLFSSLEMRCKLRPVIAEVDRLLRPEGKLIVRDNAQTINKIVIMAKSLHWEIRMTYSKESEGLLFVQKKMWRPTEFDTDSSFS